MIRGIPCCVLLFAIACSAAVQASDPAPINTEYLLTDMTELSTFAWYPAPGFTCRQFSSYDRAAKSPTENWFANGDCGQYLRVEDREGRKEYVMMDAAGPGAIVRIWSANPAGTLRIYLDGAEKPVIEAPMTDLLGGKFPGLPKPISCEVSHGWNLYLPIPYAKHCKVTSDQGKFYYHVNYRTYPQGTLVESFKLADITKLKPRIDAVIERLGGSAPAKSPAKPFESTVAPGQTVSLASLTGPGAIDRFQVRWTPSGNRDEPALRGVVLEMTFDGEKTVEAPLGDFFGTAPGLNAYGSLPLSVTADGVLESGWVMPYKAAAEIRVRNLNAAAVSLKGEVASQSQPWTERSMHFHAKWRSEYDVPTEPKFDWNYLTVKGKGIFAGVAFSIDNPVKDWWGEGDEKIYVDGETFPSHFGTGTEDYYGYAWCFPGLFTHAYHNQSRCDGPGNFGRTSVNRFHVLDRIPFTTDFKFDMEIWHWRSCKVNLGLTGYWYAMPGGTDNFKPLTAESVVVRPAPELTVLKVKGALEGEQMQIVQKAGNPEPQRWDGDSGEFHLWWRGAKPGETLVLGFPVEKAGKYKISGKFVKAIDYGITQFAVNGQKAGEPIDFFHEGVILVGPIELGMFELKAGQNTLSLTVVGANPKAQKAYMTGLDYILLIPQ
jgi:hypothetical protein